MTATRHGRALMFQGTGSDVGKSLLVAGLCRAFSRRGLAVRPFKPQNMSNNAAVTIDGGEIGRAQALQARAAGVAPSVHMNPVLLKPTSEVGAQVVVQGRVMTTASAMDYHDLKPTLMPRVLESFGKLSAEADLVLVEGAGSAAEVNLRHADIANMGFAMAAEVPVILVGDIDRGGVIASLVGTHVLLEPEERKRVAGYVINKFRGDPRLFESGIAAIDGHTGLRCFGVVPFFPAARDLPKEDVMALDRAGPGERAEGAGRIRIAVPRLSRIANFDDLDPLSAEEDVDLVMVAPGETIPGDADVVIIPGSKATRADMSFLRSQGWDVDIAAHVRRGGMVVGLCGGYQMLGRKVADPGGVEGPAGDSPGLGLLDVETVMTGDKTLELVDGTDMVSGEAVTGYEMHLGLTAGHGRQRPWIELADGRHDGAMSDDGLVMGCYLHGIFAADAFRHAFLSRIRQGRTSGLAYEMRIEAALDGLATLLERHLDLDGLLAAATPPRAG